MAIEIPSTGGLSDPQIDLAEAQLGSPLPSAWRAFARRHDGAVPKANTFPTADNESGVRRFVPLLEAASLRQEIEGFPRHGVPIAEDDCGNYVWGSPATGALFFWDHEVEDERPPIAPDLAAFLAFLQPFDPAEPAPAQVLRAWIDPDFKAEFD